MDNTITKKPFCSTDPIVETHQNHFNTRTEAHQHMSKATRTKPQALLLCPHHVGFQDMYERHAHRSELAEQQMTRHFSPFHTNPFCKPPPHVTFPCAESVKRWNKNSQNGNVVIGSSSPFRSKRKNQD